jgi:hypothetical protein
LAQIHPPAGICGHDHDVCAPAAHGHDAVLRRAGGRGDDGVRGAICEDACIQGQAQCTVDDDALRRWALDEADGQARVVGEDGAHADHHRLMRGAKLVSQPQRRLAADPL